MTISKLLKEIEKDGKHYSAYESQDKYSNYKHYEIFVSDVGSPIAYEVIKTARTTWKKKLEELTR